ncbi:MAG: DUF1805 domain-containing protein [Candidatus Omnitrophota bacterium]|jgi:uncharacterized protein YunC (DUF1805 family)
MIQHRKIKVGKKSIETFLIPLLGKNFILLKGARGYIMCGYLNLNAARKFREVAVKITGVKTIAEALKTSVHSCSPAAAKLGIVKGQPITAVLKIIA